MHGLLKREIISYFKHKMWQLLVITKYRKRLVCGRSPRKTNLMKKIKYFRSPKLEFLIDFYFVQKRFITDLVYQPLLLLINTSMTKKCHKPYFAAVALHTSQQKIVFGPFTLQANYLMVAFFTLKSAINSLIVLTSLFTPRIASTHFAFCFLTPVSLASPSLECRCRLHCIIAGILSNSIDLQMVVCLSTGRQADGGSQSAKQKLQSPAATFLFFPILRFYLLQLLLCAPQICTWISEMGR